MKSLFLFLTLIVWGVVSAQPVFIANEHFSSKVPQGWTVNPVSQPTSLSWTQDTDLYVSASYAPHAHIPFQSGDSIELITPFFNCNSYPYVMLRFHQICKVLPSDFCRVYYQEQQLGSPWKMLPADAYTGSAVSYKNGLCFHHASYTDWEPGDTARTPTNTWWKEETFDLSDYASYTTLRFKFVLKKGSFMGSIFAKGWYIDDFQLLGALYPIKPPLVAFRSNLSDTQLSVGPFVVTAAVASRSGIGLYHPYLRYTAVRGNTVKTDSIRMVNRGGDTLWEAVLPQHEYGTTLQYSIVGRDSGGNTATVSSYLYLKYAKSYDSCSAAVVSLERPEGTASSPQAVTVRIANRGTKPLLSAEVGWSVNGVKQPSLRYSGYLPCDFQDTLTLGSYIPKLGDVDTLTVWVGKPNGVTDTYTRDDTLQRTVVGCGNHGEAPVISVGAKSLYPTVTAALSAFISCLTGGIVLEIDSGHYAGLQLDRLSGVSDSARIVIRSASGKASDVVFSGTYGMELSRSSHLVFENLTFQGSSIGVKLSNWLEDVCIRGCRILTSTTGTSSSCRAVSHDNYSGSGCLNNVRFVGNTITGGYYNMYFYYSAVRFDSIMRSSVYIDSNEMSEAYSAGVYAEYYTRFVRISHNMITNRNGVENFSGIRIVEHNRADSILANRIRLNTRSNAYGIYMSYYVNYPNYKFVMAANNDIRVEAGNKAYGVYEKDYMYMSYYHNTIYAVSPNGYAYGIYNAAVHGNMKNNLLWTDSPNGYPVYYTGVSYINKDGARDYNCYYDKNGIIGYANGGVRRSIAAMTALDTLQDLHSVTLLPKLKNSQSADLKVETDSRLVVPYLPLVPRDREGRLRYPQTLIGAYEKEPVKLDAAVAAVVNPSFGLGSQKVYVRLSNSGQDTLDSLRVCSRINGVLNPEVSWSGSLPAGADTVLEVCTANIYRPGPFSLTVWLVSVNGVQDMFAGNDTLSLTASVCMGGWSGTYTLGGVSPDFATLDEFLNLLSICGLSGPVTLKLRSGIYSCSNLQGPFKGSSVVNTVTLMPDSAATVTFLGSGQTPALSLQDLSHWVFRDLTFGDTVNGKIGVSMSGGVDSVLFIGCRMYAETNANSRALVYNNASAKGYVKRLYLVGNTIVGGYYNLFFSYTAGTSADWNGSLIYIDSNTMRGAYYAALNAEYNCHLVRIASNTITNGSLSQTFYGMCFKENIRLDNIIGNRIRLNTPENAYGLYFYYYVNYPDYKTGVVANNEIILNGSGTQYGICESDYMYMSYYHNSVCVRSSNGTAYGFYNSNVHGNFKNNLLWTDAPKSYPVYYTGVSYIHKDGPRDYNNYYSPDGMVGYANGGYRRSVSELAAQDTLQDKHSVSLAVKTVNSGLTDLKVEPDSRLVMPRLPLVTDDIDGKMRSVYTMAGAYERDPLTLDAGLQDFAHTRFEAGSQTVYVRLINMGLDTLTSVRIGSRVNGVLNTEVTWTGSLAMMEDTVLKICSMNIAPLSSVQLSVWLVSVNGKKDMDVHNDTLSIMDILCSGGMKGTFTLGGASPDFASLEVFQSLLSRCGLSGPVTLKIRSGHYSTVSFTGPYKGSSAVNTVTLMPDSGAVVTFLGNGNTPALSVRNLSDFVFRNLTIGDTLSGKKGLNLEGSMERVYFRHCRFYSSTMGRDTSYRAVSYLNTANSGYPVDLHLVGNTFVGGYYNLYFFGIALKESNLPYSSVYIDSNVLREAYATAMYSEMYCHLASISCNRITNRSNCSRFYGMRFFDYQRIDRIVGNRIHLNTSGEAYGIYMRYYVNYPNYTTGVTVNNEIILSGSGNKYGVYEQDYMYMSYYHNSIYVRINSGTGYPYYNAAVHGKVENNIFAVDAPSGYAVCYTGVSYIHKDGNRDNNCYYSSTGNIAYSNGSARKNLADLIAQDTLQDDSSIVGTPLFYDYPHSLKLKDFGKFTCPSKASYPTDIRGIVRTSRTTMGCYGDSITDGVDLMLALLSPVSADSGYRCYSDSETVCVAVRNIGFRTADFGISPLRLTLTVSGPVTYRKDTVISSGSLACSESDTLVLGTIPTIGSGSYLLHLSLAHSADVLPANDTLTCTYRVDRIRVPYDQQFVSTPMEITTFDVSGSCSWQLSSGSGTCPSLSPVFGSRCLMFPGYNHSGSISNAVLNAVNIRDCIHPQLKFWYAHSRFTGSYDMLLVSVTVDQGVTLMELGRILASDTADYWKEYVFDLSAFTQYECISIVFQAVGFGGCNQKIDRICLTAEQNAGLYWRKPLLDSLDICSLSAHPLELVLVNDHAVDIRLENDTVRAFLSGAVQRTIEYVYTGTLPAKGADTLTLDTGMDFSAGGRYMLEAFLQSRDNNPSDDTLRDTLDIRPSLVLSEVSGVDTLHPYHENDTLWMTVVLRNTGNIPVSDPVVRVEVNGTTAFSDTLLHFLRAGDSLRQTLRLPVTVPAVTEEQPFFMVEADLSYACRPGVTDSCILIFPVEIPDTVDLALLDLLYPSASDTLSGLVEVSPLLKAANRGNLKVEEIHCHVEIYDSSDVLLSHKIGYISGMEKRTELEIPLSPLKFQIPDYTGSYRIRIYLQAHPSDIDYTNDTLCLIRACRQSVQDTDGLAEPVGCAWTLGQNLPNPAAGQTRIPYRVPKEGGAVLFLYTVHGQLLLREEAWIPAGDGCWELDITALGAGIYYYTMKFDGQKQTRRLEVVR